MDVSRGEALALGHFMKAARVVVGGGCSECLSLLPLSCLSPASPAAILSPPSPSAANIPLIGIQDKAGEYKKEEVSEGDTEWADSRHSSLLHHVQYLTCSSQMRLHALRCAARTAGGMYSCFALAGWIAGITDDAASRQASNHGSTIQRSSGHAAAAATDSSDGKRVRTIICSEPFSRVRRRDHSCAFDASNIHLQPAKKEVDAPSPWRSRRTSFVESAAPLDAGAWGIVGQDSSFLRRSSVHFILEGFPFLLFPVNGFDLLHLLI